MNENEVIFKNQQTDEVLKTVLIFPTPVSKLKLLVGYVKQLMGIYVKNDGFIGNCLADDACLHLLNEISRIVPTNDSEENYLLDLHNLLELNCIDEIIRIFFTEGYMSAQELKNMSTDSQDIAQEISTFSAQKIPKPSMICRINNINYYNPLLEAMSNRSQS